MDLVLNEVCGRVVDDHDLVVGRERVFELPGEG
jgi:hypothetical protein